MESYYMILYYESSYGIILNDIILWIIIWNHIMLDAMFIQLITFWISTLAYVSVST